MASSSQIALTTAAERKGRVQDIARIAGVGVATVDRVLNERGNVSQTTAEKVLAIARQLNMKRVLPVSHHRLLRIEALLPRPELPLISRMNEELACLARRMGRSVVIHRTVIPTDNPRAVAKLIRDSQANGLIFYSQENPEIHQAIEMAHQRGTPVVTIFSDLPRSNRLAYAGSDPYVAGRTAGYFMAKMASRTGSVAVLCSCSSVHGHEQRRRGFGAALKTYGAGLEVTDVIEGGDDSVKSEILLRQTFADRRDLVGIYNVGAANDAVGNWLRRCFEGERPIFIGHELTHETRPMLRDGTMALAIDQNPEQQARFAVEVLLHHFGHERARHLTTPYKSEVSFRLFTPENIVDVSDPPASVMESHHFATFGAAASR